MKAIAAVVHEGCFEVDEARICLQAMDPSNIAMVDFELPGEFFDDCRCEGEPRISIMIGELLKFLDRVERNERVEIRLDEEKARLVIQCTRPGHTRRHCGGHFFFLSLGSLGFSPKASACFLMSPRSRLMPAPCRYPTPPSSGGPS